MRKFFWPLVISIALSLGILLGGFVVSSSYRANTFYTNANKIKLNKLIDFIEQEYVDEVNTDSIVDQTVASILEQLDPHSVYIAKDAMQLVSESMKGEFVGIGISFYVYQDSLAVIKDIPGGPAEKGGIVPGDRILFADGEPLFGQGVQSDSLVSKLKGEENSKVKVEVYRKKDASRFETTLTRSMIPIKSVDVGMRLGDSLGYIKINRFSETTYAEFKRALDVLLQTPVSGLILDLRDNGGGYMEQAVKILDEFLGEDKVIVKTVNKKGRETLTKATAKGSYQEGDLYILVNEGTASASEIIAGAIQDNDRGTIIGRRTFGKGLVQRELYLGDGSAIRLTTARYYTPSGRSIQKPYNHGFEEYNNDFITRYERGELYAADSIKVADSLQFKTLSGRVVYGGGGIVPDEFVPIASKHGDEVIILLMRSGVVSYFVFEQIDKDRNFFEKSSLSELETYVKKEGKLFSAFRAHLNKQGLNFNFNKRKDLIEFYLVAEFINQLYTEKEYYRWLLKEDTMIALVVKKEGIKEK